MLDQEQGYEKASDSPIAVKERVNSFELIMSQSNSQERRQGRFIQELFPGREIRLDLPWRREVALLLQLRVLSSDLFQNRDFRISILPERQEIVVCKFRIRPVTSHEICPSQLHRS